MCLRRLLIESSSLLAEWYFENSQPVTAACCHLAVSDVQVGASGMSIHMGLETKSKSSLDLSPFQSVMRIEIIYGTLEGQHA